MPQIVNLNNMNPVVPNDTKDVPQIVTTDEIVSYVKDLMTKAGCFSRDEIEWTEGVATRLDKQPGMDQVLPIIQTAKEYLEKLDKDDLTPWDKLHHQSMMRKAIEFVKITAYKQKRIVIAVPQRKQHPRHTIPNLAGLIATQTVRCDVITCFGMGYAESRTYLVKKALETAANTHILFVDDDILIPIDSVEKMVRAELPVVCGLYTKKNPTLESVSTMAIPGGEYLVENVMVNPNPNDFTPTQVGCFGLGFTMFSLDLFKHRLPEPWFDFIHEIKPDGTKGRVLVGEDSRLSQLLQAKGIRSFAIPGLCGVHTDFRTGEQFGPEWLVDPETRKLKKEHIPFYTAFPKDLDVRELASTDNDTVFCQQW